MRPDSFRCLCLNPLSDGVAPRIAVAAARAGAVGVLDAEHVADTRTLEGALEFLCARTTGPVGLRLAASQVPSCCSILETLNVREHWLVLAGPAADIRGCLSVLPDAGARTLLVEVTDSADAAALPARGIGGAPAACWAMASSMAVGTVTAMTTTATSPKARARQQAAVATW